MKRDDQIEVSKYRWFSIGMRRRAEIVAVATIDRVVARVVLWNVSLS